MTKTSEQQHLLVMVMKILYVKLISNSVCRFLYGWSYGSTLTALGLLLYKVSYYYNLLTFPCFSYKHIAVTDLTLTLLFKEFTVWPIWFYIKFAPPLSSNSAPYDSWDSWHGNSVTAALKQTFNYCESVNIYCITLYIFA